MAVLAKHTVGEYLFDFECAQWAEMTDAAQADWTVIENTCGFAQDLGQPFASNFVGAGNGLAVVDSRLADLRGEFGHAHQTLFLDRRMP